MNSLFGKSTVLGLFLGGILAMSLVSSFSAYMLMSDVDMHDCPFMGIVSLCDMSPLNHIAQWKQMFAATSQQFATTTLLLLLAFATFWLFLEHLQPPKRQSVLRPRYKYRERIFDPLQLAFARGILNSKAY